MVFVSCTANVNSETYVSGTTNTSDEQTEEVFPTNPMTLQQVGQKTDHEYNAVQSKLEEARKEIALLKRQLEFLSKQCI